MILINHEGSSSPADLSTFGTIDLQLMYLSSDNKRGFNWSNDSGTLVDLETVFITGETSERSA